MTHRPAWACSKCGHQLGEVLANGAVCAWTKSISTPDCTAVNCPRCETPNVWRHKVETASR